MLKISKYKSHSKKNKINIRPCVSKLEKDIKSGKMMAWGTSTLTPRKVKPEHLEARVGPDLNQEDHLAIGRKARPKAA